MDLKPVMYQDVRQLDAGEVRVEEIRRNSLLKEVNRRTTFRSLIKRKISLLHCVPVSTSAKYMSVMYISLTVKCHFQ